MDDGAATLTDYTVQAVGAALRWLPERPERWLVCGGGRRNLAMMDGLRRRLNAPVETVEAAGFDGDMLEAQAFAFLAARVLRGLPTSWPSTTGARAPVCGGRVWD
ncbi:MAG: anhydro-N-acetylmuramic acid kinase [Rubrimonas sp.]